MAKIGFLNGFKYLCIDVNDFKVENRRFKIVILAFMSAMLMLAGCQKIKDIRVTSTKIVSLDIRGLSGAEIIIEAGVDNPAREISLSEIEGELKHSGKVLGRVAVAPIVLKSKTHEKYQIEATVKIGEDATLRDVMMFADVRKLGECTVDVSALAKIKGGGKKKIAVKDIPMKELLERVSNEKI